MSVSHSFAPSQEMCLPIRTGDESNIATVTSFMAHLVQAGIMASRHYLRETGHSLAQSDRAHRNFVDSSLDEIAGPFLVTTPTGVVPDCRTAIRHQAKAYPTRTGERDHHGHHRYEVEWQGGMEAASRSIRWQSLQREERPGPLISDVLVGRGGHREIQTRPSHRSDGDSRR